MSVDWVFLPGPKMKLIRGGQLVYSVGGFRQKTTVCDFWLDETPVTVAQYKEAVIAGVCKPPTRISRNKHSNWGVEGREDHPVNCVDWYQASAYAKWAGKRLALFKEWAWAARSGPEARLYPWGNVEPSNQLCWNGSGNDLGFHERQSTSRVGSYPQSDTKEGIKDMAGNVSEWVFDDIDSPKKGCKQRCGGGWAEDSPYFFACTNSRSAAPDYKNEFIGFRCAMSCLYV